MDMYRSLLRPSRKISEKIPNKTSVQKEILEYKNKNIFKSRNYIINKIKKRLKF